MWMCYCYHKRAKASFPASTLLLEPLNIIDVLIMNMVKIAHVQ